MQLRFQEDYTIPNIISSDEDEEEESTELFLACPGIQGKNDWRRSRNSSSRIRRSARYRRSLASRKRWRCLRWKPARTAHRGTRWRYRGLSAKSTTSATPSIPVATTTTITTIPPAAIITPTTIGPDKIQWSRIFFSASARRCRKIQFKCSKYLGHLEGKI